MVGVMDGMRLMCGVWRMRAGSSGEEKEMWMRHVVRANNEHGVVMMDGEWQWQ